MRRQRTIFAATAALIATGWLMAGPSHAAKWRVYEDCKLIENDFNDGDSLHVKRGRQHEIYRLYFVDAGETDPELADRIHDQATYWNVSEARVLELGKEATHFTAEFLKSGFTVLTRREDAGGRSDRGRMFAVITVGDRDLAEALTEAGLVRIYGRMPDLPDGRSWQKARAELRAIERRAQRDKRGAWQPETSAHEALLPKVTEQDVVLRRSIVVYALETGASMGVLKAGRTLHVLGAESAMMVRVRFEADGKTYEAQCRKLDLGL
jgi:endonuclease YncB( thermonuclease family)